MTKNTTPNTANPDLVLQLKNAHRTFITGGHKLEILKDINLDIHRGHITILFAPSGSGKTTLLYGAGLLEPFDGGQVIVDGKNIMNATDQERTQIRRNHMGYVYQLHNLLPEFSALENLEITGRIAGMSKADAQSRATTLLHTVGLGERLHSRPSELSGGERQRVAIVRSVMNSPSVILADEPTGNLDTESSTAVFSMFMDLVRTENVGLLLVTHNPVFLQYADTVVTLKEGRAEPLDKSGVPNPVAKQGKGFPK